MTAHGRRPRLPGGAPNGTTVRRSTAPPRWPCCWRTRRGVVPSGRLVDAAAYAFRIAENQRSLDGNKRTAIGAALVFLDLNAASISGADQELYDAMMGISARTMSKSQLATFLRKLALETRRRLDQPRGDGLPILHGVVQPEERNCQHTPAARLETPGSRWCQRRENPDSSSNQSISLPSAGCFAVVGCRRPSDALSTRSAPCTRPGATGWPAAGSTAPAVRFAG